MKILIVPDSFKGTLTSEEVCECIREGIESVADAEITTLPFADSGEGFADCLAKTRKAETLYCWCSDIYGKRVKKSIFTYEDTAIIETAQASGIQKKKDVMHATSYGTGELIKHAVSKGFKNIIVGLGGSGCCDGGAGALAALGAVFRNIYGEIIEYPTGENLEEIYGANFRNIVKGINFTYACDVDNPYYGKNGAAYVFAPQKGASKEDVIHLDNGLKMINAFLPNDISAVRGGGAAGGICGGLYSVYGGEIKSGFDILSEAYNLEEKIKESDLIITGEGKTDKQTLMGKLPYKIFKLSAKYGKKCVVISGKIEDAEFGDCMISLCDRDHSFEYCLEHPKEILRNKAKLILQ